MQPEFNGKQIFDLTDEEYFEFCTTVLNMDISKEEALEMRANTGKYAEIFNSPIPDIDLNEAREQGKDIYVILPSKNIQ